MDLTRKQSTNIEPGKEFGRGPMNAFVNIHSGVFRKSSG